MDDAVEREIRERAEFIAAVRKRERRRALLAMFKPEPLTWPVDDWRLGYDPSKEDR